MSQPSPKAPGPIFPDDRIVAKLEEIKSGNWDESTPEKLDHLIEYLKTLFCQHQWEEKTHINEDADERDYEVCKKCGAIKED